MENYIKKDNLISPLLLYAVPCVIYLLKKMETFQSGLEVGYGLGHF